MEPIGIQGLPPLLSTITSVVPVAIPESGSEAPVSTLTELSPVRSAKPTTATECLLSGESSQAEGSNAEAEGRNPRGAAEEPNMPQQVSSPSVSEEPPSVEGNNMCPGKITNYQSSSHFSQLTLLIFTHIMTIFLIFFKS